MKQANILLEDGTLLTGKAFGSDGTVSGEVVVHTGMINYQEVLSNPSYYGQIVILTNPIIGSYGVTRYEFEGHRPTVSGMIVREYEELPSNWNTQYELDSLFQTSGIVGISEIDTRMLTRKIRNQGTMRGFLTTESLTIEEMKAKLAAIKPLNNQVELVSTKTKYSIPGFNERIVVVDFGLKKSILRDLALRGCDVVVVPYDTTAEEILSLQPHGVLLSNGPGNPTDVMKAVQEVQKLVGKVPLFGIGLGHQLFALACGATVEKMKFGHRGANYPVKNISLNRCVTTSQNHGYVVAPLAEENVELEVTYTNQNDGTIAGLKHTKYAAFSVQFHPETTPGTFDASYLFDEFLKLIQSFRESSDNMPRQRQMLETQLQKDLRQGGLLNA